MKAQDLKNSILQLAIQGKLVEQRAEEGTAKELLEKIKAEKKQLIQEGKIKKQKALPAINEDEIPFDIPDSWEWVKLGDVFDLIMGQSPKGTSVFEGDGGIEFHQGKVYFGNDYLEYSNQSTNKPTKIVEPSTVLLCVRAPVGILNITDRQICIGRGLCGINTFGGMDSKFVMHSLRAFKYDFIRKATGTTFVAITGEVVKNQLIPLPPLQEQKRIVAKIEELIPYVDKYDVAYSEVVKLNKKFPEDMQKSILQYAIQGKLVEQRKEDGTAEELYQQIQEEKKMLIEEGKIKKTKALPEITEDEIPFDIPESWKWVRLGNLLNKLTDGTHSTPKYTVTGVPFISVKDVSGGKMDFSNTKFISQEEHDSLYKRCNPERDDILLTKVGTTGIPVIVDSDQEFSLFVSVALLKFNTDLIFNKYFMYAIKAPVVQIQARENTRGVGNKNWVMRDIANTILPLPPLNEQKRIVDELEKLLPYTKQLVK